MAIPKAEDKLRRDLRADLDKAEQARGFGIEQDFVANLTGAPQYLGDDLGEGVCQSLSVLDQLRLGLRHVEIDITSGYFEALERELALARRRLRELGVDDFEELGDDEGLG